MKKPTARVLLGRLLRSIERQAPRPSDPFPEGARPEVPFPENVTPRDPFPESVEPSGRRSDTPALPRSPR